MVKKEEVEFFKDVKVVLFLFNKYVHAGDIKHIGSDCLVLDDERKGLKSIQFDDIQEIREDRHKLKQW